MRHFMPCASPTEEVGLWDCVEGKFYPNNGCTAFLFWICDLLASAASQF